MPKGLRHRRIDITTFQWIIMGFIGVILMGTLLLMLPISTKQRIVTSFHDAAFTAVSAVCVTGLVVKDTGSYWSTFGQMIIILLIQIGGLGVITIAVAFAIFSGRRINLMSRSTMQSSISAPYVGGIVRLTRFIVLGTFTIEGIGALLLMPRFIPLYGLEGIWMSVFHSISAFCNAGFDILGTKNNMFPSLVGFQNDTVVNVVIMLLIMIGGIGFLTWDDIYHHTYHFKKYRLQSKIVLITTFFLVVLPAVLFFFVDFQTLPLKERILASLFQSVTTRTAGFNTVDLTKMSSASKGVMTILMLIGASPSSTAGGMKITTFVIIVTTAFSVFNQKDETDLFDRRFTIAALRQAMTIFVMYLTMFFVVAMFISIHDGFILSDCLFETASAAGTVGLTLSLTTKLSHISQTLLMMLMFLGRVGTLTLIYATKRVSKHVYKKMPEEMVTVG